MISLIFRQTLRNSRAEHYLIEGEDDNGVTCIHLIISVQNSFDKIASRSSDGKSINSGIVPKSSRCKLLSQLSSDGLLTSAFEWLIRDHHGHALRRRTE